MRSPILGLMLAGALASSCARDAKPRGPDAAPGALRVTTDSTFARDVLDPGEPAVVEFWAHMCMPCYRLEPHLKKLSARYAGRVTFWKLNVGWNAKPRYVYDFHAVPTMIFYRGGREVARQVGMPSPGTDEALVRFVEQGLQTSLE